MKSNEHIDIRTWNLIQRISQNIKTIRKKKGLTQADMAVHGFGARWYQRLESGKHIPTIPTLDKLAYAFSTDVSEFFK
jgi:transcriptional regulator with XRE-family HTH domain